MKILIISPGYIPLASVGKMRMASLSKYLAEFDDVTVMHNSISSYAKITDEKPPDGIKTIEVDPGKDFISGVRAYKKALREQIHIKKYDVILISVGPFYVLPLVILSKKLDDITVVIDYRDLWTESYRKNAKQQRVKKFIKSFFYEKPSLLKADVVVSVDEGSVKALVDQYPFLKTKRTAAIYNGYDDDALEGLIIKKRSLEPGWKKLTIAVYGKFQPYIGEERLLWFAEGLERFAKENGVTISIIQYGQKETAFEQIMRRAHISFEWRGFVRYREGMEALNNEADALLVASDGIKGYGTKVFDYIFLDRPILMFAFPDSDLYRFVNGFDNGYSFFTEEELLKGLQSLYREGAEFLSESMDPSEYGRTKQNKKFRELLCEQAQRSV